LPDEGLEEIPNSHQKNSQSMSSSMEVQGQGKQGSENNY